MSCICKHSSAVFSTVVATIYSISSKEVGLWLLTITSTDRDGVLLESKVTTVDISSAANISGSGIEVRHIEVIFTVLKRH